MYNSHAQMQRQYQNQNRYINNRLTSEYQKSVSNNTPYPQNPLLMNNPNFVANIHNSDFYTRMNLEKMEQIRRIKDVKDLGINEKQLTDYIICPIVVAKEDSKELDRKHKERGYNYLSFGADKFDETCEYTGENMPEFLRMLWSARSNNPYKNILKKEDYSKSFKKKSDLVIHKVSKKDKKLLKTLKDFEDMQEFIVLHNGELKIKFSKKKKNEYKEKFDYINKVKYSFKYDPKNFNDLKQFYKQEQKKIKRAGKRVDEMLEILLASDSLTKDEIAEISAQNVDENEEDLSFKFKTESSKSKKFEKELEEELGLTGCELEKMLKEEIKLSKTIEKRIKEHEKNMNNDSDDDVKPKKNKKVVKKDDSDNQKSPIKTKKITKVSKNVSDEDESPKKSNKVTNSVKNSQIESTESKPKIIAIKKVEKNIEKEESQPIKKPVISIKPKIEKQTEQQPTPDVMPKKKLVTIIKPNEQKKEEAKVGQVADDLMAKYKDKQKKAKKKPDE